jgi:hypothetical protein
MRAVQSCPRLRQCWQRSQHHRMNTRRSPRMCHSQLQRAEAMRLRCLGVYDMLQATHYSQALECVLYQAGKVDCMCAAMTARTAHLSCCKFFSVQHTSDSQKGNGLGPNHRLCNRRAWAVQGRAGEAGCGVVRPRIAQHVVGACCAAVVVLADIDRAAQALAAEAAGIPVHIQRQHIACITCRAALQVCAVGGPAFCKQGDPGDHCNLTCRRPAHNMVEVS